MESRTKEYYKNYSRQRRLKYPEEDSIYQRRYRQRLRSQIYDILGKQCILCGYSGLALCIDHVNDNGYKYRRIHKNGSSVGRLVIILKEVKEGSKDYQILCANCNLEKEINRLLRNTHGTTVHPCKGQ